jgi:hypothetical protein
MCAEKTSKTSYRLHPLYNIRKVAMFAIAPRAILYGHNILLK